jgi:hypothetical protein
VEELFVKNKNVEIVCSGCMMGTVELLALLLDHSILSFGYRTEIEVYSRVLILLILYEFLYSLLR